MIGFAFSVIMGAKRLASVAFSFLRGLPPLALLSLALAMFAGVQTWRVSGVGKQRDVAAMQVRVMTTVLRETDRRIRDASQRATDAARANKTRVEARQETAREESDVRLETIRADYRARTDAYARRMRATQAAGRDAGGGNMPVTPDPAPSDNGPGDATIMVTRTDLEICTDNTARVEAAHDWAKGLNDGQN